MSPFRMSALICDMEIFNCSATSGRVKNLRMGRVYEELSTTAAWRSRSVDNWLGEDSQGRDDDDSDAVHQAGLMQEQVTVRS